LTESGHADITPPGAIAGLHPNGKFALIGVERALGVFVVNAENGLFTPTSHAVDLGSMEISHLVFTADGRRAHAPTGRAVLELTFNPDSGDIAIAGGTLISADANTPGNHIARLAVAGEGRFVYAAGKPGTIFGFRFDARTGELAHLGVPEVPCFVPFAA